MVIIEWYFSSRGIVKLLFYKINCLKITWFLWRDFTCQLKPKLKGCLKGLALRVIKLIRTS